MKFMHIVPLMNPVRVEEYHQLVDLLIDCVHAGASIGFLDSLSREEARDYWLSVTAKAGTGERTILVARDPSGNIVGSAQIAFETRPNGRHRAEVQKVLVLTAHRRTGIARQLMAEIETLAQSRQVRLLFLDTSEGKGGARLFYEAIGYSYVGGIPGYALDPDGSPAKNAIYYKELASVS
jgi:acetyltransferase